MESLCAVAQRFIERSSSTVGPVAKGNIKASSKARSSGVVKQGAEPGSGLGSSLISVARDRAFRAIVGRAKVFPEINTGDLDESGLDSRDGALVHMIVDTVCRHWLTLEFLIDLHCKEPLRDVEHKMQAVLLGGAAQIVYMDRVPVHAAIDTAVEWAKKYVRPGAGGMVNAVLRRVAEMVGAGEDRARRGAWTNQRDELLMRDGSALVLSSPVLPDQITARTAIVTSHPIGLVRRWVSQLGADEALRVAAHSLAVPPVTLNSAFVRAPLPDMDGAGMGCTRHATTGCHVAHEPGPWLGEMLSVRDDVWVQDAASVLAIRSIADLRPKVVADVCAGQGTKTRQLAATFPDAEIWASDPDPARSAVLATVFKGSAQVRVVSPLKLAESVRGKVELALLDVPCSNTGVLARRAEAKYRCGPEQLERLVTLQKEIFEATAGLMAPGSSMLYSTCSLDDGENIEVVEGAARVFEAKLSRANRTLPSGRPGGAAEEYSDGAFSALLSRK